MEDGVSLSLLKDHDEDGRYLGDAVCQYLNEEWIDQPVHRDIGNKLTELYISNRAEGVTDLGEFLMNTGTAFESFPMDQAFVNAWDIANKASDILMARMDRELCACMGDMSAYQPSKSEAVDGQPVQDVELSYSYTVPLPSLSAVVAEFSGEFERYRFLQEFLDCQSETNAVAKDKWGRAMGCLLVLLGFEAGSEGACAPPGCAEAGVWADLMGTGSSSSSGGGKQVVGAVMLDGSKGEALFERLEAEIQVQEQDNSEPDPFADPKDAAALSREGGVLIETLLGGEYLANLRQESDGERNAENAELDKRIVLVKWLYGRGFLTEVFPPNAR
jgi:hypothetical protein